MMLSLAFLAPDIAQAAIDGTLPKVINVSRLIDLLPEWSERRKTLGLA